MPARELGNSSLEPPNGAHGVGTSLLKRHKILPHPRDVQSQDSHTLATPAFKPGKPRDLIIDTTETRSIPSSDTTASSPRILKHTSKRIGAPDLPPTPPTHSRQSSGTQLLIVAAPVFDIEKAEDRSILSTPPNARSPPTPDVTPPRMPPLTHQTQNRHRPPLPTAPSSRNDSFKTAREDPFSSDEEASTVRPILPSVRTSAVEVPRVQAMKKRKDVGLGLGLESDNEGTTTPKPTATDRSQEEFVVFDGEWGTDVNEVTKEWDSNLMRNVVVRKRPQRTLYTNGVKDMALEDNMVTPTAATRVVRNLPLQERLAMHKLAKDQMDRTPAADRYSWTSKMEEPPTPQRSVTLPEIVTRHIARDKADTRPAANRYSWTPTEDSPASREVRRVSTMSGKSTNSAPVKATVAYLPPMRKQTLRHTKKQIALRDISSDQSTLSSAPTSATSVEPVHRLHHASVRIPDRKHQSQTSATTSTTSSSGRERSRREIIKAGGVPAVIIPDRKSSIRSSKAPSLRSTSSKRRSASLGPAPLSHSAKFNDPGYFDAAPINRGRANSESGGSGSGSTRTIDFPPKIPARRSSLSAPTSRSTSRGPSITGSRTGSLTAESLKAHNALQSQAKTTAPEPAVHITPPAAIEAVKRETSTSPEQTRLNVDHNGDPFFGDRLNTQGLTTPFSTLSYETQGTAAEVSQAQLISIFPHQNKSVLVVQHEATPPASKRLTQTTTNSSSDRTERAVTANSEFSKPTIGEVVPETPPQKNAELMDDVDSPLRNPRAPPEPPVFKFIPPTPAGTEEGKELGAEAQTQINPPTSDEQPKRSMSLIRRFSSRRRRDSEPASFQPTGGIRRFLSLSKRDSSAQGKRSTSEGSTQTSRALANPDPLYPSVLDPPAPSDNTKLHPFWRPAHFWDDLEGETSSAEFDDSAWPAVDNRPTLLKRSLSEKFKRSIGIESESDRWDRRLEKDEDTERRTINRTPGGHLRVAKKGEAGSEKKRYPPDSTPRNIHHHTRSRPLPYISDYDHRSLNARTMSSASTWGSNFQDGNGGKSPKRNPVLGVSESWNGLRRRLSEKKRERLKEELRISGPLELRGGVDEVLKGRERERDRERSAGWSDDERWGGRGLKA